MLQIDDKIVSLDLVEKYFHCDLESCLGACCIEGDAGAPLTEAEYERLCELLPEVYPLLTPAAQRVIEEQGPGYYDEEGDLVTSIVDGRDCVFTTYAPGGLCLCALEKAHREGKIPFFKPESCHLYPVRLKEYSGFTAVNMHHWKICKCAEPNLCCHLNIKVKKLEKFDSCYLFRSKTLLMNIHLSLRFIILMTIPNY